MSPSKMSRKKDSDMEHVTFTYNLTLETGEGDDQGHWVMNIDLGDHDLGMMPGLQAKVDLRRGSECYDEADFGPQAALILLAGNSNERVQFARINNKTVQLFFQGWMEEPAMVQDGEDCFKFYKGYLVTLVNKLEESEADDEDANPGTEENGIDDGTGLDKEWAWLNEVNETDPAPESSEPVEEIKLPFTVKRALLDFCEKVVDLASLALVIPVLFAIYHSTFGDQSFVGDIAELVAIYVGAIVALSALIKKLR